MNRRLLVCVTNMARQLALVVSIFLSLGATPQAFATSGPLPGYYDSCAGAAVGPAAGLFNSFPSDTQVHTRTLISSGSNYNYQVQLKRIADIKIGDEVLALDELKAHDLSQNDQSAKSAQSYQKVTDIISSHREQTLVHLTLDNGQTLSATQGHPFKTEEGWRDAILLKKGGKLLLKGGEGDADSNAAQSYATITDVQIEQKITPVFNLEVAQLHTFYVGVDGVVVHNGKSGYTPPPRGPLPGFPDANRSGHGPGDRARWNIGDGFLLWDSMHGRCEKYNKRGKHQGEFDVNGTQTKPRNPNYDLPKGSF